MMRRAACIAFAVVLVMLPHAAHAATKRNSSATKKSSTASHGRKGKHALPGNVRPRRLESDHALYRREYLRRLAFPDSVLDFIPAALRKHWRLDTVVVGRLFPGDSAPSPVACAWTTVGPTNVAGRVTGIAVTTIPSSSNVRVFVTTVGGVWRSMDSGKSWGRLTDGLKPGVFGAIAVTPHYPTETSPPDEVFIGGGDPNHFEASRAGGPGLWHSTTGGTSWTHVPSVLDDAVIFRIQVDPNPPHNAYIASSKGVYFINRASGALLIDRLDSFDAPTSDIVVAFPPQVAAPVVYAGAYELGTMGHRGIWKWDSGTTPHWNWRSNGFQGNSTHIEAIHLAIAPSDPKVLYAKISSNDDPTWPDRERDSKLLEVYKTTVGGVGNSGCGEAWCKITSPQIADSFDEDYFYDYYNGALLVDPRDPNKVFMGNLGLWCKSSETTDWFSVQFSQNLDFRQAKGNVHDDVHALAFDPSIDTDPSHPTTLWVGDDGGVHFSTVQDDEGNFDHWESRSRGITTAEFWGIDTQQADVMPLLGGTQDNGTAVTYGNRTWYAERECDGAQAGLDVANRATAYRSCNTNVHRMSTIVPGLKNAWAEHPFNSGPAPLSPFAVDQKLPGHIISAGLNTSDKPCIETTINGEDWVRASGSIQVVPNVRMEVSCLAIAPSTADCGAGDFSTYYVGLISAEGYTPTIALLATHDSGATWKKTIAGLPLLSPNGITVDRCDPDIAFAGFGGDGGEAGRVFVTQDGGTTWADLPFPLNDPNWPPVPVTGVAVDPTPRATGPEIIYVTTALGVCRGQVTLGSTPTVTWQHFSEGLPQIAPELSVPCTSLEAHLASHTLMIGTLGYGAFQRDVSNSDAQCPAALLSLRDNVFDRGEPVSPNNIPDPEHPVCVTQPDCEEYIPDGSSAGMLHWWESPDIRIDTPCDLQSPPTCTPNQLAPTGVLDPVQVESCPTNTFHCDAGLMRDHIPERGKMNRVYVQVTNRGVQTAHSLRVYAMWADASTTVPMLPSDFWSQTFPTSGGACHPLTETTGWHPFEAFNSSDPCASIKTIRTLEPGKSDVVHFDWQTPNDLPAHSCVLAMVDGDDDAIPAAARAEFRPWMLVPNNHQIGQRNLHLADIDTTALNSVSLVDSVTLRNALAGLQDLVIRTGSLDPTDTLSIMLPKLSTPLVLVNVDTLRTGITHDERRIAHALDLDSTLVYRIRYPGGTIRNLDVSGGGKYRIGLRYALRLKTPRALVPRFTLMSKQANTIIGGSTYVTRLHH